MNYWIIPGIVNIKNIEQLKPYKHLNKAVVTFMPKRNQITIPSKTRGLMNVKTGDYLKIINFDEDFYIVKAYDGLPLLKNGNSTVIASAGICILIRDKFKARQSIVCDIKETKSFFEGSPMYRIMIPQLYKNIYNKNKNKQNL